LSHPAEQKNSCPGKSLKKSFDPVGRSHLLNVGFNTCCITLVFGKMIEIGQMSTAAIYHEAQYLFEKLKNPKPLFILSNGAFVAICSGISGLGI
jgi:hypothetical protein